ncbi:MAG: cpo, partial [Frankiales bacterium]|nr:cpo [Frankiales bacterium]
MRRALLPLALTAAAAAALLPAPALAAPSGTDTTAAVLAWYDATRDAVAREGWSAAGNQQVVATRAWAIGWGAADDALGQLPRGGGRQVREDAQVAALTGAVHDALAEISPSSRPALDRVRDQVLAGLDTEADRRALAVGQAAAARHVHDREGDGLTVSEVNAPFPTPAPGPGVWQPTPPSFAPAVQAGQGRARPFVLPDVASRYVAPPPPALDDERTLASLREVDAVGSASSTVRTAAQTDLARFWSQTSVGGFTDLLRPVTADAARDLPRAVHLVAVFHEVTADVQITLYAAKYRYLRWRPVTALRTEDADPRTPYDPAFTPLLATPAHPEYPSG